MKITQEQVRKAMECSTADELIALAQSEGVDLTQEQAEEYIEQIKLYELSIDELANVAGGKAMNVNDVMDLAEASSSLCKNKNCSSKCIDCSTYSPLH